MADELENNENSQNYVELTESQIFKKIKENLNPIQENLIEQKITVDEAKSELKKINEWLQWTKLEKKDKKEIWEAFEKLTKLEKDIDENTLKNEVDEIKDLLETLTKKNLKNLKDSVKKHVPWQSEQKHQNESQHPTEADEWRKESSDNFDLTVNEATNDKNPVARKFGELMKKLMA